MKKRRYHGNKQKNSMSGRIEAVSKAKYNLKLDIALQMCADAALIAADEINELSVDEARRFQNKYAETLNEIATLLVADAKDDKDLVYSTATVDARLRQIVGDENFVDWEGRYGK